MSLEDNMRGLSERGTDFFDAREASIIAVSLVLIGLLAVSLVLSSGDVRSSYILDNSTEISYIEDNKIGSLILQNRDSLPVIYRPENMRVCIYTSDNRSPLLIDLKQPERVYLESGEIRSMDLNITLPEEKLSRSGLDQEMSVKKQKRCPIRDSPRIILTAEK